MKNIIDKLENNLGDKLENILTKKEITKINRALVDDDYRIVDDKEIEEIEKKLTTLEEIYNV